MAELAPPNYNTPAMQVLIEVMKNPPPRLKDGPWWLSLSHTFCV
jgi:hypothetical protein